MPVLIVLALACAFWAPIAGASIQLLVPGKPVVTLDRTALATLPRGKASGTMHGKTQAGFEGVRLRDVVRDVRGPATQKLPGADLARVVLVTASDGYQVAFSLGELDAGFGDRTVLLADSQQGQPLAKGDGPFRLVVPDDKRGGRWVRDVRRIELLTVGKPAGKAR